MSDVAQRVGPYEFTGTDDQHHVIQIFDDRSCAGTMQLVLTDSQILEVMVFLLALMRGEK